MTTEQYAIVVTGIVGVAGVLSPLAIAVLNHRHEVERAQGARLYAQRVSTYQALSRFLERERLRLHRTAPLVTQSREPPPEATDEEWIEMVAAVSIGGAQQVEDAMNAYSEQAVAFAGHVLTLQGLQQQQGHQQLPAAWQEVTAARTRALAAIERVERVMRDELASL